MIIKHQLKTENRAKLSILLRKKNRTFAHSKSAKQLYIKMIMTLDNYKFTLLTAVFIFIILPARGQIKFPSYKPVEQNFRAATQPEARTQQFYSITSEEGQATIVVERGNYTPTIPPTTNRKDNGNYNATGLSLQSGKSIKSYGGGNAMASSSYQRGTSKGANSTINSNSSLPNLAFIKKKQTETDIETLQQEETIQDFSNEEMQRLPSEPGFNPDLMPIPSGIPFMLICAAIYAFIGRKKRND